jgi:hypothetical protein
VARRTAETIVAELGCDMTRFPTADHAAREERDHRNDCPADGFMAAGTGCTEDGDPCSLDRCDGNSPTCQHPAGNAGATSRGAAGSSAGSTW